MKHYTIKEAARILGISIKTIYYYYYKSKNPQHFVQVVRDGTQKPILMATEKFIEDYRSKKLSEQEYGRLVSSYYDLIERIDKVFDCGENYYRIYAIFIKFIKKHDIDGIFDGMEEAKIKSILVNLYFKSTQRGKALEKIFKAIKEELKQVELKGAEA